MCECVLYTRKVHFESRGRGGRDEGGGGGRRRRGEGERRKEEERKKDIKETDSYEVPLAECFR